MTVHQETRLISDQSAESPAATVTTRSCVKRSNDRGTTINGSPSYPCSRAVASASDAHSSPTIVAAPIPCRSIDDAVWTLQTEHPQ